MSHDIWQSIIFISKVAGGLSVIGGLLIGGMRWMARVVKKVTTISDNVAELTTKHFPGIQVDLKTLKDNQESVKTDLKVLNVTVSGLSTRVDESKSAVHTLGEAFVRHLEANAERAAATPRRKRKSGIEMATVAHS